MMSSRMTDAERRAFNDGIQAALFAICIAKVQDFPLRTDLADDVCQGCSNLPEKQKQLCTRIKALHYGRPERSRMGILSKETI